MVQFYSKTHTYPDPPATPLLAFFLRYPNPFARHVLSVDVLSRRIDPVTGRLHTTRLILKRGILPKWANQWLPVAGASGGRGLDAWVLEESVVDPPDWTDQPDDDQAPGGPSRLAQVVDARTRHAEPRLRVVQGNLNHRKFMHVIEGGEIGAGPAGSTLHYTTAEIRSNFGGRWSSLLRQRIESYGVGKFEVNTETVGLPLCLDQVKLREEARKGMALILDLIRRRQPLPGDSDEPPPPLSEPGD